MCTNSPCVCSVAVAILLKPAAPWRSLIPLLRPLPCGPPFRRRTACAVPWPTYWTCPSSVCALLLQTLVEAGPKAQLHLEYVLVALLAMRLQRPVKYTEDRLEHFLTTSQEREQIHRVQVAFNLDGTIVGLRDAMYIDAGAYTPAG